MVFKGVNRRLFRTFHLNETYGWLFANRTQGWYIHRRLYHQAKNVKSESLIGADEAAKQPSEGREVSDVFGSRLTAKTAVQNIEDSDERGGGGVELRIKIYSPRTKIYSPFKY